MPEHHHTTQVTGAVTDIFAHRFVVQTKSGKILADLGPKGAEKTELREGDMVVLTGEMKPSELKVRQIARNGDDPIAIEHPAKPKPHDGHEPYVDPKPVVDAVKTLGFAVLGDPRRKPKHFEILGRDHFGTLSELHVEFDGKIRKTKPVDRQEGKWSEELSLGH